MWVVCSTQDTCYCHIKVSHYECHYWDQAPTLSIISERMHLKNNSYLSHCELICSQNLRTCLKIFKRKCHIFCGPLKQVSQLQLQFHFKKFGKVQTFCSCSFYRPMRARAARRHPPHTPTDVTPLSPSWVQGTFHILFTQLKSDQNFYLFHLVQSATICTK